MSEPTVLGYGVEVGGVVYRFDDERSAMLYATQYGLKVLVLVSAKDYADMLKEKPND